MNAKEQELFELLSYINGLVADSMYRALRGQFNRVCPLIGVNVPQKAEMARALAEKLSVQEAKENQNESD